MVKKYNRRHFFIFSSFAFVSLLSWRIIPLRNKKTLDSWLFSNYQLQILMHIFNAILEDEKISEVQASNFMQKFTNLNIHGRDRLELKVGIYLFEHSPLLLGMSFQRFTSLNSTLKQKCLHKLSKHKLLYPLYKGFKELSYMTHYSQENSWSLIGYDGPIVSDDEKFPEFNNQYLSLLAKK